MADQNLVTFQSHHEALDDWALMELTGHLVNYRKQVSPSLQELLPLEAFRLYAICSSYPHNLAQEVALEQIQPGVYECRRGTNRIRVIVASQLPQAEHNAPLHLFSAKADRVGYGAKHYRRHSANTSSVVEQLFQGYDHEGAVMSYTMEDFQRDYVKMHFKDLTPQERQECIGLLSASELRELFTRMPPEEILKSLPREEIEKYLKQKSEQKSDKRKSRRR